jgi:hypothetical protein
MEVFRMLRYEITIQSMGKQIGSSDKTFQGFNTEHLNFDSLGGVQDFLTERYGEVKNRAKIYEDIDTEPKHCGYVYRFRNADWSHAPVEEWMQEDWVTVYECERRSIIIGPRKTAAA